MVQTDRAIARDKESDRPWLGRFFVSLETSGESVYLRRPRVWHPPTDVYETDSNVMVKIEVAGVQEEELVVRLQERVLTVRGHRGDPAAKLSYQQMEISYGEFCSEVTLPCDVDETGVEASYDKGFLYIQLPKQRLQHKVPIRTGRARSTR